MHRTPLYQFHIDHGAKMVDFAGWEMPLLYTGIIAEHKQVRSSGGVFDVSHMGRAWFTGADAARLLDRACTRRIADMQPGQARYTLVTNEAGGVRDDVLVYRFDDDQYMVVINAANREKLLSHFQTLAAGLNVKIDDRTFKTAMVAIQGPRVMNMIAELSEEIASLKRFRFTTQGVLTAKATISRTGYTGEDGVEAIVPAAAAKMAIDMLAKRVNLDADDAPIKPAGLGARDTLRLEAGMPLYGHELDEQSSALASGLDFAINLDKDEQGFEPCLGAEALKRQRDAGGPAEKLIGLLIEGGRSARQGMTVKLDGEAVGRVSSACVSPTLNQPIAMAYVRRELAEPGRSLHIDADRRTFNAQTTALPFYKPLKK